MRQFVFIPEDLFSGHRPETVTLNENPPRTRAPRTVTTHQDPYEDPRTRTRIAMASHVVPTTCGVLPRATRRHKLQQEKSSDCEGDASDRAEHASDRRTDSYYTELMEMDPRLPVLPESLALAGALQDLGSRGVPERHTWEHREDFAQRSQQPLSRS